MHNQQFLHHPNLVLSIFRKVYSQNSDYDINSVEKKMNNKQVTGYKLQAGERKVLNMNACSRQELVCFHARTLQYASRSTTVQLSSVLVYFFPLTPTNILVFVCLHWTTLGKFSFPCLSLPVRGYILS